MYRSGKAWGYRIVSMLYILVKSKTMCSTWDKCHKETIRIRWGCSTYYMRYWLRLLAVQPIMSSYSWPFSMLSSGGINHNRLRDMWTCRTILASAYMLCHLSTIWSQLQMIEKSLRWEWVLIWCVAIEYQRLSSIRSYFCWLSN